MVAGCLGGDPAAWRFFVVQYVPLAAALLARHFPALTGRREEILRQALLEARADDARFFRNYQGHSEREFLLHWREHVLAVGAREGAPAATPEITLDWDMFQNALRDLTILERQMVWLSILSPRPDDAPQILRTSADSFTAALQKAQEALRAGLDRWNAAMLAENRGGLLESARAARSGECPPPKRFLRLFDGQITWRDRQELEHHLAACWFCVDVLCRFREVIYLKATVQPLAETAGGPYLEALGFSAVQPSRWRRLLPAGRRQI